MQEKVVLAEETGEVDKKSRKKALKRDTGWIGWGLILYMVILNVIVAVDMIWRITMESFRNGMAGETSEEMIREMAAKMAESASSMILAVSVGCLFLWLFMGKRVPVKPMFESKKRMTAGTFFRLFAVFMSAQFVFSFASQLLELGLNQLGYSAMESLEEATGEAQTVSMFFYASFIAPAAEELIYRGFVIEPLRKHGKVFAIVVSAVLFGVMHANIPQAMFAIAVGFVLGYTAMEYSITWAILLHMINNFVFGELLSRTTGIFEYISPLILTLLFFAGIIILWNNRSGVKAYLTEHTTEKGKYRYAFTTVPILLFILYHLISGIAMLTPLQ